jgi:hypothetical protein
VPRAASGKMRVAHPAGDQRFETYLLRRRVSPGSGIRAVDPSAGLMDRPGDRISDPRTGRGSALLRPRLGKDHLGRSAGRLGATRAAAGDPSAGVDPPRPISVTFIPASVFDNPALLQVNPEYLAWLLSLPLLESERLLRGNWKIRPAAGLYFKRQGVSSSTKFRRISILFVTGISPLPRRPSSTTRTAP